MTYDNSKSKKKKKTGLHPFPEKHIFGKTAGLEFPPAVLGLMHQKKVNVRKIK